MGRGFGVAAAVSEDVIREVAAEAERLGYSSFWANDTPGHDGLVALAAAASVTRRVRLGVGVIPLDRRPSAEIAADVERLGLPQERLWLGVGSGGDPRGLTLVREGVRDLKARLTAEIDVAALGPNMCRLAGAESDGVLFNWLIPSFAERSGAWVTDAAAAAGRPHPTLMAYVRCALLPHAEARLEREAGSYASYPKYAAHFARMGVSARDTCVSGPDAATLQAGIAAHERVLDETVVRAITADDSAASILELLRACAPDAARSIGMR
jgi:alkanesulfonate monooxygenase SsuD/methylene tetrahydromethanopterin reductase-like flavin-dependent oxidoreductase (luciferase family)